MSDDWDDDEVEKAATQGGITTLSLIVREDGILVDSLDMPQLLTLDVALVQLPAARAFQRKLAQFAAECEARIIQHMTAEGAKEIPGFVLEQPTTYIVADQEGFDMALASLTQQGKLKATDYQKAVVHTHIPAQDTRTFDNRTLNSLAGKRGAAVADVIHKHRTEMLGAPRLKVKG